MINFCRIATYIATKPHSKIVREVGVEIEFKAAALTRCRWPLYSKDNDNKPNKLVIIEFKKPQLIFLKTTRLWFVLHFRLLNLADRIKTVRGSFSFSIVEIDDEFYRDIKQTGFKDVFSLNERVVYNDFSHRII